MKRRNPILVESSQDDAKPSRRAAPLIIFGGILAIGFTTVAVVLITQCNTGQKFDEMVPAREIRPGVYVNPEEDLRPKAQQRYDR